jgi:hypothetical protein
LVAQSAGQEPTVQELDVKKQIANFWMEASREYAKECVIHPIERPDSPFKLHEHPVFHHIQAVRGNDIGAVHLWIDDQKRPAAICTVFGWTINDSMRMLHQEFHSLADEPIVASRQGDEFWQAKIAGTNWQPIPNGPIPADSIRRRRQQTKQIASKFSSYMIDINDRRWELRRVPTPIYEYDVKDRPERGGALFAFCRGTDVETLLLLEVRDNGQSPRWEFTCAKFTDYEPHMLCEESDVWKPFEDAYRVSGNPHYWAPIGPREMPQIEIDSRR